MALLHRDRPATAADDTVAGTTDRPAPARHADEAERGGDEPLIIRKNSLGQTVRTILATLLLVAVVAIAAANTDDVGVDLLFDEYDASLSALLGVAAVAGFLIGTLLMWGRTRRHRV